MRPDVTRTWLAASARPPICTSRPPMAISRMSSTCVTGALRDRAHRLARRPVGGRLLGARQGLPVDGGDDPVARRDRLDGALQRALAGDQAAADDAAQHRDRGSDAGGDGQAAPGPRPRPGRRDGERRSRGPQRGDEPAMRGDRHALPGTIPVRPQAPARARRRERERSGGASVAAAVGPAVLGPVAADGHRAPAPRLVARRVVERPAAAVLGAHLEPPPGAVAHRARRRPRRCAPLPRRRPRRRAEPASPAGPKRGAARRARPRRRAPPPPTARAARPR